MNLDDKIKQELETDKANIDEILADDQGLFDMFFATFKSNMKFWVILVNIFTLVFTVLMFWTLYEFFTGSDSPDRWFWGICALMAMSAQIALKQWMYLEMYRNSIMRELKRVELAVARLSSK